MHPLLNIAIGAARRAGDVIVRSLDRVGALVVSEKGRNDFVSEVDRAAEQVLIASIRKAYPSHGFLAEEDTLELMAEKGKYAGRPVRAEGNLVNGTLVRRDQPCEYRFRLSKNGTELPVKYAGCIVPDTFRDIPGMPVSVTVEGQLQSDNTFEATNVLAKCPSKYEDKMKDGVALPYAAGSAPGAFST